MATTCKARCSTHPSVLRGPDPVPLVHGLTLGEAATMGCAEGWIEVPEGWRPFVVKCIGWSHGTDFRLPVRPSPNLPTTAAIDLYPSLCLFEPTAISVGRGTEEPFTMLGHPDLALGSHEFIPKPIEGAAPHPNTNSCALAALNGLADVWRMNSSTQGGRQLPGFSLSPLEEWAMPGAGTETWMASSRHPPFLTNWPAQIHSARPRKTSR